MKKDQIAAEQQNDSNAVETVHPLKKSYMFVSNRHVDYENLSAFESVSMSLVLVLALTAGQMIALNLVG